jgi:DNA repair protein RadD
VMDRPKLTGDIIEHWRKLASGRRTVGYAVNVAHSYHMAEQFTAAGIPAAHLDGDTPTAERRRIIMDFAEGRVQVLFNVNLFGEGFDLSAIAGRDVTIDAAILARPTQSLSLYLQQSMRPMRPAPGKTAIILDHAGNSMRHGFPDDPRDWSLDGRETAGRKAANDNGPPPPVTCSNCFNQVRQPTPPACPHCGHALRKEFKPVEVADGELREISDADKAAIRAKLRREESEAKTLSDLAALGAKRGYKNPQGWAFKRWSASKWRQKLAS